MDAPEIVKVEPIDNIFAITWSLTSHCNYDCSYCPPVLHNKEGRFHSIETLQEAWQNLYAQIKPSGLPIKITFTGGEITTVKHFLPFVKWLRNNFSEISWILLVTNGSASTNLYKKLSRYVEAITFSVHSEFFNEKKFFETAIAINKLMIRPEKSFHINVMNEPWNQDRIKMYEALLNDHNISYSVNEINFRSPKHMIPVLQGEYNLEIRKSPKL